MKLFKFKNLAMMGAMSVAGLGLVGAGAHAVFTSSTASTQTITAGTLAVVVSAPHSTCPSYTYGCQSLILNPVGPVGSTFTTGDQAVTATNTGSVPAYETSWTLTASPGSQFVNEASLCIVRQALSGPYEGTWVYYNGPLSDENGVVVPIAGWPALIPGPGGATDTYTVNVYAGSETTACGAAPYSSTHQWTTATTGLSTAPSLGNYSESLSMTVSVALTYGDSD